MTKTTLNEPAFLTPGRLNHYYMTLKTIFEPWATDPSKL